MEKCTKPNSCSHCGGFTADGFCSDPDWCRCKNKAPNALEAAMYWGGIYFDETTSDARILNHFTPEWIHDMYFWKIEDCNDLGGYTLAECAAACIAERDRLRVVACS